MTYETKSPASLDGEALQHQSLGRVSDVQKVITTTQQKQTAEGKVHRLTSGKWDRAREIRNAAILQTIKNSQRSAPCPSYKSLPSLNLLNKRFKPKFEQGKLISKIARGGLKPGDEVGTPTNEGYIQVYVDYKPYKLHRLLWKMCTGRDPIGQIDHRDGDRSNSAISNLREVTPLENSQNRHSPAKSNSGVRGVSRCSTYGRWLATIGAANRTVHLGAFKKKACAIAAREHAEDILFDEIRRAA